MIRQRQNLQIFFTLNNELMLPQALCKLKMSARLQNSDSKMTQTEPFRPIQFLAETQRTLTRENV